jgi:hypothetical protein
VRTVRPDLLIPIHAEHPEYRDGKLMGTGIEMRNPELGIGMQK